MYAAFASVFEAASAGSGCVDVIVSIAIVLDRSELCPSRIGVVSSAALGGLLLPEIDDVSTHPLLSLG